MCAYHPFLFPWHGRGRAPSAQAFGTRTDRQKALRLVMGCAERYASTARLATEAVGQ
jgi:hypothetical protein